MKWYFSNLPLPARIAANIILLPFRIFGWVAKELLGQAVRGAKKTFAPLLWPLVAIAFLVLLYFVAGPEILGVVAQLAIVLAMMFFAFRIMIFGFPKPKKKKKK
ncbi:MAG TPA: hypothetical protein VD928_03560 [Candidatus Paceibacterota bacterium]|nr:hypothetical protein [Candidatus Paceibacterota bacterium]